MGLTTFFLSPSKRLKKSANKSYLELGEGPALVILPSPFHVAATYRPLAEHLSRHFRVYVPELPGSGLNPATQEPPAVSELTEWVIDFLYECKIERAFLLGHSNSGPIALSAAVHAPRKIKGLILADTIGVQKQSLARFFISRFWDALIEAPFSLRSGPHLLYNFLNHTRNFLHQIQKCLQTDLDELMNFAEVETLIAWGEQDHTSPVAHARYLQERLPYASLCTLRGGSHDWILTHPAKITEAIRTWALPQATLPVLKKVRHLSVAPSLGTEVQV